MPQQRCAWHRSRALLHQSQRFLNGRDLVLGQPFQHPVIMRADLGLSGGDIIDLFDMFDQDKSGNIDMSEFLQGGYEVIGDLARERAINELLYME